MSIIDIDISDQLYTTGYLLMYKGMMGSYVLSRTSVMIPTEDSHFFVSEEVKKEDYDMDHHVILPSFVIVENTPGIYRGFITVTDESEDVARTGKDIILPYFHVGDQIEVKIIVKPKFEVESLHMSCTILPYIGDDEVISACTIDYSLNPVFFIDQVSLSFVDVLHAKHLI